MAELVCSALQSHMKLGYSNWNEEINPGKLVSLQMKRFKRKKKKLAQRPEMSE